MAQWQIVISGSGDIHQEAAAEKATSEIVATLRATGNTIESASFVHVAREEQRIDKLSEVQAP